MSDLCRGWPLATMAFTVWHSWSSIGVSSGAAPWKVEAMKLCWKLLASALFGGIAPGGRLGPGESSAEFLRETGFCRWLCLSESVQVRERLGVLRRMWFGSVDTGAMCSASGIKAGGVCMAHSSGQEEIRNLPRRRYSP